MIEHTEDMRLGLGKTICPEGRYYVTLRIARGKEGATAMIRPISGLHFGLMIVLKSLKALCFCK